MSHTLFNKLWPIPKIEDLFATLGGGKSFTKLDMSQAYHQIEFNDDSKQYTVVLFGVIIEYSP